MYIEIIKDIEGTPLKEGQKIKGIDGFAAFGLIKRGLAKEVKEVKKGRKPVTKVKDSE